MSIYFKTLVIISYSNKEIHAYKQTYRQADKARRESGRQSCRQAGRQAQRQGGGGENHSSEEIIILECASLLSWEEWRENERRGEERKGMRERDGTTKEGKEREKAREMRK